MENETRFDLNAAVAQWRKNLQSSPALRPQDIAELETHLRESTQALHARGLTLEKAFLEASHRLGPRRELEPEYGKVNGHHVWVHRVVWMLVGLVFFSLVGWSSHIIIGPLVHLAMGSSMSAHWIGFLSFGARWLITALAVTVLWKLVTQRDDRVTRLALRCLQRPLLPIIGIVLLSYAWQPLQRWLLQLTSPGHAAMELKAPILTAWAIWTNRLNMALWMAALTWLASATWRKKEASLQQPNEHHVTSEASDLREISMERGVWMLGGFVFIGLFLSEVFIAVQVALLKVAQWWSPEGNLFGFLAICVQWAIVAGFLTAVWRLVTRSSSLRDRILDLGMRRPVLGFIGLTLLYVGLLASCLLAHLIPTGPSYADHSLVLDWMEYGHRFLNNVVFVAILFWLARRQIQAGNKMGTFQPRCD
jgi:hypothetical protein